MNAAAHPPVRELVTIEELAVRVGRTPAGLAALARSAGKAWRTSVLEKESKHSRTLRIPSPELKALQKLILKYVLPAVPLHRAACCAKGRGVLEAVQAHAGHPFLLHVDIAAFFPSVTNARVESALEAGGFDPRAARLISALTMSDNQLPQGAPTSVYLSNLVLKRLDRKLAGLAKNIGLTYSRYVDDIAVSGGLKLSGLEARIRWTVQDDGWTIRTDGVAGPQVRHSYLGLVLNTMPNASPEFVADVSLILSRLRRGRLAITNRERQQLRGRISFITSVNERLGARLLRMFPEPAEA